MDANLIFRDESAGNLTATMATVYKKVGKITSKHVIRITVPAAALGNADNTLIPTVHLDADGSGAGARQITGETINNTEVVTNGRQEFFITVPPSPYDYVGLTLTVAGTTPNFGAVEATLVPAGRYDER